MGTKAYLKTTEILSKREHILIGAGGGIEFQTRE